MLEKAVTNRRIFFTLISIVLVCIIYGLIDIPRPVEGSTFFRGAYWWEVLINVVGAISLFILWGGALTHAYNHSRTKWVIMSFLIWPLALVYSFLLNTKYVEE